MRTYQGTNTQQTKLNYKVIIPVPLPFFIELFERISWTKRKGQSTAVCHANNENCLHAMLRGNHNMQPKAPLVFFHACRGGLLQCNRTLPTPNQLELHERSRTRATLIFWFPKKTEKQKCGTACHRPTSCLHFGFYFECSHFGLCSCFTLSISRTKPKTSICQIELSQSVIDEAAIK